MTTSNMCNANIFRTLNADEIEVRVQQVTNSAKKRAVLLLYKNARVDMDMLDEKFGCLGWQREHNFKDGKNYCKISVYDTDKQMWISKEDVGVESNTEETKGEASDSFKRSAVTLGIGRELYSAPSILIDLADDEWQLNQKSGKPQMNSWIKFKVSAITYSEDRKIIGLSIVDARGNIRYTMGEKHKPQAQSQQQAKPKKKLTVDDLMADGVSTRICEWLKDKANGQKIADVMNAYYDCDAEVIDCITNEYLRIYAS
jgi:hypothetical protein